MNRLLLALSVAAIAGFGVFIWTNSKPQVPGVTLGSVSAEEAQDIDTSMVTEMTLGNPEAAVTVIEYASFTCPHCKTFHEGTFKQLKADYIDTGKIHFIYREVYFDRPGLWAAAVARCGGEERYFGITDLIYENQREWASSNDPATVADNLRRLGRTAGFTDEEVNACLQDGDKLRAMIALYQQNASADGIRSTPSFIIDGQQYGNMSYDEFSAILDEKLGG